MASSSKVYHYEYTDIQKREREGRDKDYQHYKVSGSFTSETLTQWIEEDIQNKTDDDKYTPENLHRIERDPNDRFMKQDMIVFNDVVHAFVFLEAAYGSLGCGSVYHAIRHLPEYIPKKMMWLHMGNIEQELAAFYEVVRENWIFLPNTKSTGYEVIWWSIGYLQDDFKKPARYVELEKKAIEAAQERMSKEISKRITPILREEITDELDYQKHWDSIFEKIKRETYGIFNSYIDIPPRKRKQRYYRY